MAIGQKIFRSMIQSSFNDAWVRIFYAPCFIECDSNPQNVDVLSASLVTITRPFPVSSKRKCFTLLLCPSRKLQNTRIGII